MHRILTTVITLVVALVMTPSVATATATATATAADRTDRTNLSFISGGVTSTYHLYAAGLDWTKPVGLLVYTDGTGEYGLKNPSSSYLLGGSNGMVNVAKRNNMVLLTPRAPGAGCDCWYEASGGYSPAQKAKWSHDLIQSVQKDYGTDRARVALGGYSSGAQWLTRWYVPGHAVESMTDGVAVAISYGGPSAVTDRTSQAFKSDVHLNWNSGSADSATESAYGARGGYNWYTPRGFRTSFDVVQGVGHSRSGQFGAIMDAQIKEHVTAGTAAPTPEPEPEPEPPAPQPEPSPDSLLRLSGDNRYATSVAVSQHVSSTAYDRANTLVVINAWATADALSASSVGGTVLLLPDSDSVPTVIRDEIVRRDPAHVYIVGGTAVVSRQQEQIIASLLD